MSHQNVTSDKQPIRLLGTHPENIRVVLVYLQLLIKDLFHV